MHPHTIIATVLGCGVIAVVAFVRPRVEEVVFGDVIEVPEGARQQRAIGGSNSLTTDAQDRTNKVIARPHNGTVTR